METKRSTVYFDPAIHKALRLMSIERNETISDIVNTALRHELAEDEEDLAVFVKRAKEPAISYEALLKKLKADGKI
jgi:hypothetical protein